jgi:hypothetical protein
MTARSCPPAASAPTIGRANAAANSFFERRRRLQSTHCLVLSVQIPFQRVLDGRITQRLQRPEVVAHGRNVGPGVLRYLPQRHALLTPLREQLQGGRKKAVPRTLTGLAT